jgi:F-type H+-transporting ATPase subunit b
MNLQSLYHAGVRLLAEDGEHHLPVDDDGKITTPYAWWPEWYEIVFGGIASVLVFGALWKFAIPALKKGMADRSARIQRELDGSASALAEAKAAAATIRASKGDLDAERARMLADADATAARVLADGRARITAEAAEAETKATADIEAARARVQAELQSDVAAIAATATEQVVVGSLDGAAHQRLIEDFIAKVGAGR